VIHVTADGAASGHCLCERFMGHSMRNNLLAILAGLILATLGAWATHPGTGQRENATAAASMAPLAASASHRN
jgi:hypothetical protein